MDIPEEKGYRSFVDKMFGDSYVTPFDIFIFIMLLYYGLQYLGVIR